MRLGYGSQSLVCLEWVSCSGLDTIRCEAVQAKRWLKVPTIILCEARGLWLFWVIRGGIGLTRRLGAASAPERLMSEWILSLEPERRRTIGHRGMNPGRPPELCATLKLLAASVVLRRNVPPFSKVSKQWPRSFGLTSDAPSRASSLSPARSRRSRATDPPHSWLGSRRP